MRQTDHGVTALVHLVEYIVPEELDDVPITCLRPTWVTIESKLQVTKMDTGDRMDSDQL